MARSDVLALLSTLLDRLIDVGCCLIDGDDGFWIDIICVNFIRSRRGAGARGSRIHVRGVLGDSFCGVASRSRTPAELYIVRLLAFRTCVA